MRQVIVFNNKNVELPEPWVSPGPPNDEIWYTSSNSQIVNPYYIWSLPTIVSNIYSDGKGIIKFESDVVSIGYCAFYYCSGLTSVTIPNSVTIIGERAFHYCSSLTSVTIGNSVTSIEYRAFRDCIGLTSISYTGTIAQWNSITKGTQWHGNAPATVVHCTDGDAPI